MGLFNFWKKPEQTEDLNTFVNKADLRFRDSPIQSLNPKDAPLAAIIGAIENILGGDAPVRFLNTPLAVPGFNLYLFTAKTIGVINASKQFIKVKDAVSLPSFDSFIDSLEDQLPCILQLKMKNAEVEFVNVPRSTYPDQYYWCVSGYEPSLDALILKDIRGQAFGDNGYVYLTRENFHKCESTIGYVLTGLNYGTHYSKD
jgi:hypothetical protein